jgi:DNA-binding winged helix-turn-helix (wHTH) protein/Tol biopolymer transport system component
MISRFQWAAEKGPARIPARLHPSWGRSLETQQNLAQKWRFGVFEVDAGNLELRRNGVRVKVREQSFRVLIHLLEHAGDVVSREDLYRALWPSDTFVDFDHSLNTAVKKLRDALGDLADAPIYIETIPKRGYRFVAPVSLVAPTTQPFPAPPSNGNRAAAESSTVAASGNGLHGPMATEVSPAAAHPETVAAGARKAHWSWYVAVPALAAAVLVVLVLQTRWRSQRSSGPAVEVRVTANPADAPIQAAVISPNGKYLAYADTSGMYLREIDTGEVHALSLPKDFRATPTSWFPDGTHLLLTWRDRSEQTASIWKYSILGGDPQMIIDYGEDGVVSPDGSQIAYFHRSPAVLFGLRENPILHVVGELWIASADGQNPHRFVAPSDPNPAQTVGVEVTGVSWAPDSRRLAYIERHKALAHSRIGDQSWLLTRDLNGGAPQLILRSHRLAPEDLCWARDGRLLYALRKETSNPGGDYDLDSIRIDLATGAAADSPQLVTTGLGWIGGLSITADGKRVLLWRGNELPQVFVSEFNRSRDSLTALRRLTLDESPNQPLGWLPDSRTVLFSSDRDGKARLYKQRIDQTIGEAVLEERRSAAARMAPDGSEFLFAEQPLSENPSAPVRLMRIPTSGGEAKPVLEDTQIDNFWCSRSKICVYSKVMGRTTVLTDFDPENGKRSEVARFDGWPNWTLSPDGLQLAVVTNRNQGRIEFISIKTGRKRDVVIQDWPVIRVAQWAADSRGLLLTSFTERGTSALVESDLQGKARLLLESPPNEQFYWAVPSPDGRYVALNVITGEENVWMVENF